MVAAIGVGETSCGPCWSESGWKFEMKTGINREHKKLLLNLRFIFPFISISLENLRVRHVLKLKTE